MAVLLHPFATLEAWRRARPAGVSVVYVATEKDAKALISALCGGCDGGPICHTDHEDPAKRFAGTWEGVPIYRGASASFFLEIPH